MSKIEFSEKLIIFFVEPLGDEGAACHSKKASPLRDVERTA